jgi:hypothetical protein
MIKRYIVLSLLFTFFACKEHEPKSFAPIVLGDSTTIITETDTAYLSNITEDISPKRKYTSETHITKMMVEVDSMKKSQALESAQPGSYQVNGFIINFAECEVIFDGLAAHALNVSQNERATHSVSYLRDAGELMDMKLKVTGLQNTMVEQRLHTMLGVTHQDKTYVLHDLGKFITQWYNIAGKDNVFISLGRSSLAFHEVNQKKISLGLERELRKKKLDKDEIQEVLQTVKSIQNYSDAPCVIQIKSVQWRIRGVRDGKKVQKLIQIDNHL